MDGTGADQNKTDLEALQALQADASELDRVESLLFRFNVFEAIGFVTQELMHSRLLAFLLAPRQNHGLGDLFLKRVLREVLSSTAETPLPDFFENLDQINLDETLVRTEHQHIDSLLTNEDHELAVIVENKVWTSEHSDQLDRYYQQVKKDHPGWQVLGIYLTPYGNRPSHEAYSPLNYETVCEMLEEILEERGSALNPDVKMAIEHYTEMVRRNIVGGSEVTKLCQQIYQRHKRALDLIYEHRPDPQGAVRDTLIRLIKYTEGLAYLGKSRNEYIYFRPQHWEGSALALGDDPRGFFRFVFHNYSVYHPEELILYLEMSTGDETNRRRLYEMGQKDESLFNDLVDPGTDRNPKLYSRIFLTPELSGELSDRERELEIRERWDEFLEQDLPRIETALKKERWIWKSVETDEAHPGSPSRFVWGEGDVEIQEPPEREE
jgi:hypothetical protein